MIRPTHARTCVLPAWADPPPQPGVLNAPHRQPPGTPKEKPLGTSSLVVVGPRCLLIVWPFALLRLRSPGPGTCDWPQLPTPCLGQVPLPWWFRGPHPPGCCDSALSLPRACPHFRSFTTIILASLVPGLPMTCCGLRLGVACRTRANYPTSALKFFSTGHLLAIFLSVEREGQRMLISLV